MENWPGVKAEGEETITRGVTIWVYVQSRCPGERLWTVGFYGLDGKWEPESDHDSAEEAAKRVHYLNGGKEADSE
jgi:hypothetical protein